MSSYVSADLRRRVIKRATNRCEYCQYPQTRSFLTFEIEHIVAEKHGGRTEEANLALACPFCNRFKGTDLGSLDPETGLLTPFYNPRTQNWSDCFRLQTDGQLIALTAEGRVTVLIFQLNEPERVIERRQLIEAGDLTVQH